MRYTKIVPVVLLLVSAFAVRLSGQTHATGTDSTNNFYYLCRQYEKQLAEKGKSEKDGWVKSLLKGKKEKEGLEEDPEVVEYERWKYYWQDRLEVSSGRAGQMANVNDYMIRYAQASGSNIDFRGASSTTRGVGSDPSTLSTASPICNTGGNWSCLGPFYYSTPVLGRVTAAWVNPSNPNHILAAANGLFVTSNAGGSWSCITDASRMPTGCIEAIAVDPSNSNIIYIAGSFDSPNNQSIFAFRGCYGFGVLKTTNGGSTWTEVFTMANYTGGNVSNHVRAIRIHPQDNNSIYVLGDASVFYGYGVNTGTTYTWTQVWTSPAGTTPDMQFQPADIEILPGTSGVSNSKVMVGTLMTDWTNTMYKSPWASAKVLIATNGATTPGSFTDITTSIMPIVTPGMDQAERIAVAVQPGNNNDFFISWGSLASVDARMAKYNVPGATTTQLGSCYNNMGYGFWNHYFEFSATDPNIFYMGGLQLFRYDLSAGGLSSCGAVFSDYFALDPSSCLPLATTHGDVRAIAICTNGGNDVLVLGDDGGIQKAVFNPTTQTTMPTWLNMSTTLVLNQFFWIAGNENKPYELVGGTQDNGTTEYFASVWNWRSGGDGYRGVIDPNTNQYFGFYNAAVKGTVGTGFCYGYASVPDGGYGGNRPVAYDPVNGRLFSSGRIGGNWSMFISTDFGTTWSVMPGFPATGNYIGNIRICPDNPNVIYVSKDGPTYTYTGPNPYADHLFKCVYSGTWTTTDLQYTVSANPLGMIAWASIKDIAIDPVNSNHLFVCFNGYNPASPGSMVGAGRVYESGDGGINWGDITCTAGGTATALPPFPVTSLAYQPGTQDVLYAGNDVGVWRYNKNATGGPLWECFSNGLPIVGVTCLEINSCKGLLRAGTYGRGIWSTSIPANNTTSGQFTVSSTATWSGSRRMTSDIFITGNSNLTISGTLYMQAGRKIIVDRGSTLTVTGTGKITNCCDDMWTGVEVWGTYNVSQSTAGAQGKVVLQSGSIIENCQEGIVTIKNLGGTYDYNYVGGIIQAQGAYFYNNVRDIVFYPYQYSVANNLSYIRSCTFETNRVINNSQVPDVHVKMSGVKNVPIYGNHFKNTALATYIPIFRGTGVYATDCDFTVDDYGSTSSSTFDGLYIGVSANYTSGVVKKVQAFNSDYSNVQRGVEVNYSYNSNVQGNTFTNVPNAQSSSMSDATWAIRLNNTNTSYAQNNVISGASSSYLNNYGVIADNCGTAGGTISGNTFSNIYTGIQAQNNNGSGASGMQFKCNTFNASINYQIAVTPTSAGSLANQGSGCTLGNTRQNNFYTTGAPACGQIKVGSTTTFTYYASGTVPTLVCGGVTVTNCSSVTGECSGGPCPTCHLLNDSNDVTVYNDAIMRLTAEDTPENNIALMGVYINAGKLSEASSLIGKIRSQAGMEDVVAYYDVLMQLASSGGNIYTMNKEQLQEMEEIAGRKSPVALSAQVILAEVKGETFERITQHFPEDDRLSPVASETIDVLAQNVPNPFDNSTTIRCTVNPSAVKAVLQVSAADGKLLKTVSLTNGDNTVVIAANELGSGIYYYSLIEDGKYIATKRMVIIRN